MASLASPGNLIRVTPWDEPQFWPDPDSEWVFIEDLTSFVFQVTGWLEDGHLSYGLYGPVVDGPIRYRDLICSIVTRDDGSDWRIESCGSAFFKVGPNKVFRDHRYDFRSPEGILLEGYPRFSRYAEIAVLDE